MISAFIFDLETDGLPLKRNQRYTNVSNFPEILQISWCFAHIEDKKFISEEYYDNYLLYLGDKESFYSPGITRELLGIKGKPHADIIADICAILNKSTHIISHNIDFDVNILFAFLHKNGAMKPEYLYLKQFCTMKIGTDIVKIIGRYKGSFKYPTLNELYFYYMKENICADKAHNSKYDTECLVTIFKNMLSDSSCSQFI